MVENGISRLHVRQAKQRKEEGMHTDSPQVEANLLRLELTCEVRRLCLLAFPKAHILPHIQTSLKEARQREDAQPETDCADN